MAFEDWEKRPNGDIVTNPLMGYEIASFPMNGIVRLGFAKSDADLVARNPSSVQIGMTGPQAQELGEALLRLAARIADQPKGTRQ